MTTAQQCSAAWQATLMPIYCICWHNLCTRRFTWNSATAKSVLGLSIMRSPFHIERVSLWSLN